MRNDKPSIYEMISEEQGIRVDKYVSEHCPGLSRTRAQKLINDGYVRVNGNVARAGYKLDTGDTITVEIPPAKPVFLRSEEIPLTIIYEDDELLVVDKPAGLTVHPAPGHSSHTLVNALLSHLSELPDTGEERPGIVHRLDKDTSGVMVVAKNVTVQDNLMDQFKARTVVKRYQVLVKGHLTPEEGVIEAPVGRDPRHRQQMAVVPDSRGREATTEYTVVRYTGDFTLLEVRPVSGRTHQIRVHLKAIGFPVAGDKVYGVKAAPLTRQFVHASVLGFVIPSTGEYREFFSPLPEDLRQALATIEALS
ncbi:MAG: RluA family pseudouridine synthase [Dehalococcoidales bacterium]|nr:MAG: RluA family pseudouridine synthase [Dehalococcoidales bacterium]